MSSENTLTGRNGEFWVGGTQVARTTLWNVNPTLATTSEWGDSDSGGCTNRAAGRMDCTFTAEGKYDSLAAGNAFDLFQEGDIVEPAILYLDTGGSNWTFARALCMDFTMAVNMDTQEVIGWTSAWGSDGTYTRPS